MKSDTAEQSNSNWQAEVDELTTRKALARQMGGEARVKRQHDAGRLTVRARIESLLDRGSFHEIGSITGTAKYAPNGSIQEFTPANCVFGRGRVDNRPVMVSGDDFTVRGGSADASIWEKFKTAERLALEFKIPLIRLIEGSGGGGSVRTIESTGRANLPGGPGGQSGGLDLCCANLSAVPVVTLALGSVAGLGAARACISHYSIMVKGVSAVFVAGPPVVERLGENRTKEELGGYKVQLEAGTIDDVVEMEKDAIACARAFLSYLPSSVWQVPDRSDVSDSPTRREENLLSIIPKDAGKVYMMRRIIDAVVDRNSFFEMSRFFGRSVITGMARLNGWPVALIAGDPFFFGGAWTSAAAEKLVRFVDFAETFHLPIVHLVDCPGFRVGLEAERAGTMRHAVRAVAAINQSTVPWCSVIVRNVFGVAGGAHQPQSHVGFRYAWPSARWGSLPLGGGIEAAYRAELEESSDPRAKLAEIEASLAAVSSPFRTAEAFGVEEIIDPRDTRPLLCEFANLAAPLRTVGQSAFGLRP